MELKDIACVKVSVLAKEAFPGGAVLLVSAQAGD